MKNLMRTGIWSGKMEEKIKNIGGSGEPMFGYDPNAINIEGVMRTCITCRENRQNRTRS